jgi:phospholipase/carboxylesterase
MRLRVRSFLAVSLLAALFSCISATPEHARGRLSARPHAPSLGCPAGIQRLGMDPERESLLYVPTAAAAASTPAPLLVYLHGARGEAARGIERVRPFADANGFLVLAPQSLDFTWDTIHGSLGPDVARVDRALALAFDRCAVDPQRVFVSGFSDGASYALTLGIANGDFFARILAFSPGLVSRDVVPAGRPPVFLSHGRADDVLPIASCSRPIARALERAGYAVTFREFDGKHEIPRGVAEDAFRWMLARP